jgi:hypothetical protein
VRGVACEKSVTELGEVRGARRVNGVEGISGWMVTCVKSVCESSIIISVGTSSVSSGQETILTKAVRVACRVEEKWRR